jgi:hypothetical protein
MQTKSKRTRSPPEASSSIDAAVIGFHEPVPAFHEARGRYILETELVPRSQPIAAFGAVHR